MNNLFIMKVLLVDYFVYFFLVEEEWEWFGEFVFFFELYVCLVGVEGVVVDVGGDFVLVLVCVCLQLGIFELDDVEMFGVDVQGCIFFKIFLLICCIKVIFEFWCINILVCGWCWLIGCSNLFKFKCVLLWVCWQWVGLLCWFILLLLMLVQILVVIYYMKGILFYQGWVFVDLEELVQQSLLDIVQQVLFYVIQFGILVFFVIFFCWVLVGFWIVLMGFWELFIGCDCYWIFGGSVGSELIVVDVCMVIVMLICNEDVLWVFVGLWVIVELMVVIGEMECFDFFVFSDINDLDIVVVEQQVWFELCCEIKGFGKIFYCCCWCWVKCKSGNIDDFCWCWGGDYCYMVVMDVDSVMSGDCLVKLVCLMEVNFEVGIIQIVLKVFGMDILYVCMQQFVICVYGLLFIVGLYFW